MSQGKLQASNMNEQPVAHIYAFAITWLFFIVFDDELTPTLEDLFILAGICFVVSGVVWISCTKKIMRRNRIALAEAEQAPKIEEAEPEQPAAEDERFSLLMALEEAKNKLNNAEVTEKVNKMISISEEILEKVDRKPDLVESIRRFLNYYLPTATKMVTDYGYMEKQSIKGEHVRASMEKIEHGLTLLTEAFENQLNTLFSQTAMDVAVDVDVLEQVLKKEGLLKSDLIKTETTEET